VREVAKATQVCEVAKATQVAPETRRFYDASPSSLFLSLLVEACGDGATQNDKS